MRYNFGILIVVATKIFVIFGQELSEKDYEIMNITIEDSELHKNGSDDEYKAALRYGFHRTDACQHYEKAFLCIRKCLDFGFQIAESNKKCNCKCYKNKVLAAHKSSIAAIQMLHGSVSVTSWKFGAPTTSRPSWAKLSTEMKLSNKELFSDLSPDTSGSGSGDDEGGSAESGEGSGEGSGEVSDENATKPGTEDKAEPGSGDKSTNPPVSS